MSGNTASGPNGDHGANVLTPEFQKMEAATTAYYGEIGPYLDVLMKGSDPSLYLAANERFNAAKRAQAAHVTDTLNANAEVVTRRTYIEPTLTEAFARALSNAEPYDSRGEVHMQGVVRELRRTTSQCMERYIPTGTSPADVLSMAAPAILGAARRNDGRFDTDMPLALHDMVNAVADEAGASAWERAVLAHFMATGV